MCDKVLCKNCGTCCGPVPISRKEVHAIRTFLRAHPNVAQYARNQSFDPMKCVFRNDEECKCMIYQCRPKICQIYTCTSDSWTKTSMEVDKDLVFINQEFGNLLLRPQYDKAYMILRLKFLGMNSGKMNFLLKAQKRNP